MRNKSKPERGFNSECKECSRKKAMQYQKENIDKVINDIMDWQERNREKTWEYSRKQYKNNKEERREYVKEWVNSHPDRAKEYGENRRHKKHNINKKEWESCKDYFNDSCAYCGFPAKDHYRMYAGKQQKMELHKEHVEHDGASDLSNCVPACQSCNSVKNLKTIDEFFESKLIENFTQERYDKIMQWIIEDHKKYINKQELA